ncbi:hypothetical protein SHT65_00695 [Enterococcus faecalis]|uniref:hypothetical protein n=1 Tax=Enterococcus faecalis TaxID=1351 RepID=UPI0007669283|nr:hypothetical protein [Enterococcus faecalis]EGO2593405.1 hypothetical protein [Enterococcus faecalis]EGO2620676.1 hypothetical protein [Enterococcus faecalis]EGO2675240.1 hypothetical protein [Enterococcus faecalis]EGO2720587.1 hypothetical protein [Enterococcus faecalis]EGO2848066.1 hypothetical protein [Enterococcus faecalis]
MYSFDQVILELDNAIALKTLKNWANRIEKMTDTRFERRYAKNSAGHSYSYKVFSVKDIENFQELLRLRENNVPLNEAINEVFMSVESKVVRVKDQELEDLKRDMRQLLNVSQSIVTENADLKKRIVALEGGTTE